MSKQGGRLTIELRPHLFCRESIIPRIRTLRANLRSSLCVGHNDRTKVAHKRKGTRLMASVKRLPNDAVLIEHADGGMTNREIGDLYGTTGEAVRQALQRAGYQRRDSRASHGYYLPWKVRADHVSDVLARRLRSYSKRQQGKPLAEAEARQLEEWIKFMEGANDYGLPLSVHYSRVDEDGFWLEPRKPGDRDFISPPLEAA